MGLKHDGEVNSKVIDGVQVSQSYWVPLEIFAADVKIVVDSTNTQVFPV